MDVIYAGELTSYSYSPNRSAVGEWWHAPGRRTIFAGWLWDGKISSRDEAVRLVSMVAGK